MVLQAFEQTLVSRVDIVTISLGSHHAGAKAITYRHRHGRLNRLHRRYRITPIPSP